ncbi:MAG: trimeric intracellular cation channel family protein [Microthrixaceae bacterium]|nr:trimeric intracellular cation channel family protein [Microthrixaceae bacterium]
MTLTGLDPTLERTLDLAGVFVFAVSGGLLAAQKRFDVVGIAVLALVTGLAGGIVRDTLIGELPPIALEDQVYLVMPLAATVVLLVGHRAVERIRRPVLVFDAAGLGLFSVIGTATALDHGLGALAAVLLGVTTAVGGGVIRDVLARDVPTVFRPESSLYAIPATVGAVLTTLLWARDALGGVGAVAVSVCVFVLRLLSMRFEWRAPRPRGSARVTPPG